MEMEASVGSEQLTERAVDNTVEVVDVMAEAVVDGIDDAKKVGDDVRVVKIGIWMEFWVGKMRRKPLQKRSQR